MPALNSTYRQTGQLKNIRVWTRASW